MGYFEFSFATLVTICFIWFAFKRSKRLKECQRRSQVINNLALKKPK